MKIIFCLPGASYSGRFLQNWTSLLSELPKYNITYILSQHYLCNIYHARTKCLDVSLHLGVDQKPFGGKIEYDYIMWIDSDVIFEPSDFFRLLKHNKDIVSGLYLKKPKGHTLNDIPYEFACLKESDKGLFTTEVNGELIEVFGNGMGWMLVKKGVFEKTPFPWFGPMITGLDFNGEDIAFQVRAKDVGFNSYVDTSIVLGHEKDVVLK